MSSKASKAAYRRCPETCQKVRAEISEGIERRLADHGIDLSYKQSAELTDVAFDAALKHGTEKLRNALIECEGELEDTQKALEAAEDNLKYARDKANELEEEVTQLEKQVRNLESQLDRGGET